MTSDKKKKHWIGNIFKYGLSFALSGVFLYIAFLDVDFDKVIMYISDASIFWIIVFISSLMFAHLLRAIRWKIILRSVKKDTSLLNLFGALMVGYGVNCVVPRLGEVSRAVVLGRWENLSRSSMFGTVILERVIDFIFLGLTVLVTEIIIYNHGRAGGYYTFSLLDDKVQGKILRIHNKICRQVFRQGCGETGLYFRYAYNRIREFKRNEELCVDNYFKHPYYDDIRSQLFYRFLHRRHAAHSTCKL